MPRRSRPRTIPRATKRKKSKNARRRGPSAAPLTPWVGHAFKRPRTT
jgi:hypothetical protein